jgi:hypothetical protein
MIGLPACSGCVAQLPPQIVGTTGIGFVAPDGETDE